MVVWDDKKKDICNMNRLQNKIAVVTGASSGIGEAIAKIFAKEGAVVVCGSTNEEKGGRVVEEIKVGGGKAEFVKTDVSDPLQVENLVKSAFSNHGGLHIMVNNAGILRNGSVIDCSLEDWNKVMSVNLNGVFYGVKYAATLMKEKQIAGSIINISSIAGKMGYQNLAAYCASKGATIQLTRASALDLAPFKIRVNAICPGLIKSEMTRGMLEDPKQAEAFVQAIPLKFAGEGEDIAWMAVYLASDESRYATAQTFVVDGGWLAR
jgi:NAD(P)-dependent dehydrogenase (short-subunit alcohol dehydrogenase family)